MKEVGVLLRSTEHEDGSHRRRSIASSCIVGNLITGNAPGGETVASGGMAAIGALDAPDGETVASGGMAAIGALDGMALTDNRVKGDAVLGNDPARPTALRP